VIGPCGCHVEARAASRRSTRVEAIGSVYFAGYLPIIRFEFKLLGPLQATSA
jgi:hypothetical protein